MTTGSRATAARIGVDAGGTFTDFIARDGRVAKVPSSAASPGDVIAEGLSVLDVRSKRVEVVHGTTVVTNALLTGRKG